MAAAALPLGRGNRAFPQPDTERWRTFEITTQVLVQRPRGATRVWLPTPLAVAPYQKTMGDTYHPGGGTAVMIETNANDPDILGCSWDEGVEPALTLVSRVATTAHAVDLTAAGLELERVRIIAEATDTSHRDATRVEACDRFVGRCRDAGLTARAVYGLSLSSIDATRAQRCRAEVYLAGGGWVPIDLAGARPIVGAWHAGWIAYNFAREVRLRGSSRKPLAYLMYPQGETAEGPLDSLDPDRFAYTITVHEVP